MQRAHAGRPALCRPSSIEQGTSPHTDPSRDVGERRTRRMTAASDSRSALTPLFGGNEAMTSRIGVPRFTRMTVISPVFLLCALTVIMPSSPDDGAAAGSRLLVGASAEFVLLVMEFLLSFVGTRAERKLSSDIDFSFSEPPVS